MSPRETAIEWTGTTWNPVTGCSRISEGCAHCYAEALALRLQRMGNPRYHHGFDVVLQKDKALEPVAWRKPNRIFVNSMSDLLHAEVPDSYLDTLFGTMIDRAPWHEYQILTKRADRWPAVNDLVVKRWGRWPSHVLPGVTIESARHLGRLDHLAKVGDESTVRMVSFEPLLGSLGDPADLAVKLDACRIGWVITGGESGWSARPAELRWFEEIRDACQLSGIPYFHKQHGGRGTSEALKHGGEAATLDGLLWKERPIIKTQLCLTSTT